MWHPKYIYICRRYRAKWTSSSTTTPILVVVKKIHFDTHTPEGEDRGCVTFTTCVALQSRGASLRAPSDAPALYTGERVESTRVHKSTLLLHANDRRGHPTKRFCVWPNLDASRRGKKELNNNNVFSRWTYYSLPGKSRGEERGRKACFCHPGSEARLFITGGHT